MGFGDEIPLEMHVSAHLTPFPGFNWLAIADTTGKQKPAERPALRATMTTREQTPIDEDVIRRVAAGDTASFEQVYDAFSGPLYGLALRMLRDPSEAEDLLQDVFVKMWREAARYDATRGAPLAWAFTITRNRAIDRIRAAGRRPHTEIDPQPGNDPDPTAPAPDLEAASSESAAAVRAGLNELPADVRRTMELAYFGGQSQTEIAATLGIPLSTVKSHARRGMLELRKLLKDYA